MTSIITICNLALSNLGKDNIADLSEASAEARACNQFYEHTRDTVLQSYPWRCAGKTLSMAETTNDRPGAWEYAYTRPTDCLKIRWVRPEYSVDEPVLDGQHIHTNPFYQYDSDARLIYCNLSPAFLRYTFKQTDPTKFGPLLVDTMAWHLSVRLVMPLTRDPKLRTDTWQIAQRMQAAAEMADANEVRETSDHTTEFVTERG